MLIAVFGAAELFLISLAGDLSLQGPQAGFAGMILRSLVSAVCLLPPTCLMGASLPAVAAWAGRLRPAAHCNCGLLYAANTIGAVGGCLVAGFYLLRLFDVNIASYVAIVLNISVAALSLALAHRTQRGSRSRISG